mmetsp:Transcript_85455/g.128073  ORF Transcript_85455/g.128073 Transcript_85455/m.128073 type:complete len:94 (-) Transcript_85455:183-464(-)
MNKKDICQVTLLLNDYLSKFAVHSKYSEEDVKHMFLPKNNVIYTYVAEDEKEKKVTDFFSFYSLPSSIIKNPKHNILRAAYSFYNVANKFSLE